MKNKFYTVWRGRQIGVFSNWNDCRKQIEGFQGALYKGFPDRSSAENAFNSDFNSYIGKKNEVKSLDSLPADAPRPLQNTIAVDAACSGNPGKMEYRGVYVDTGTELFKSPVFEGGTNNIGEFLAIVHCLAWQEKNHLNIPIYSDSVNGQKWVREKTCKTKLVKNEKNTYLFEVIARAENWLRNNSFRVPIYKWKTDVWGEIPADFGRK
ncbi:MAG: viroplasmin family protein [Candidatus Limimorpha sp.]